MKKFSLALAGVLIIVSISVLPAHAGEIFGSVGYGRFAGDEGGLGFGPTYGAGIGAHPLPLLGFEFTVHGMRHSRESAGGAVRFEGTPVFVSGNVLIHFSGALIQPYVVGGIGMMHYRGTTTNTGLNVLNSSENELAMNFGAGMKIFVLPKVSLRPELRYFTSRPHNFNMMQASIGLSLHW
jgi:opacity protein-like surface antigen